MVTYTSHIVAQQAPCPTLLGKMLEVLNMEFYLALLNSENVGEIQLFLMGRNLNYLFSLYVPVAH